MTEIDISLQRPASQSQDDTLKNSVIFPSHERRSRSAENILPFHQRRMRRNSSLNSPRASPVYIEATPYHQKARKFTTYRSVHHFDDDEEGDNESDSEDEFDCEQVAAFLGTFLEEDEDDFFDD